MHDNEIQEIAKMQNDAFGRPHSATAGREDRRSVPVAIDALTIELIAIEGIVETLEKRLEPAMRSTVSEASPTSQGPLRPADCGLSGILVEVQLRLSSVERRLSSMNERIEL